MTEPFAYQDSKLAPKGRAPLYCHSRRVEVDLIRDCMICGRRDECKTMLKRLRRFGGKV